MSSITLQFDVVGDNTLESIFNELERVPDDFREPFEKMAQDFWDHEKDVFASNGPGWKPLSKKYGDWKAKHVTGAPMLVRSGALRASLTSGTAGHSVYEVYPKQMTLGTDLLYGVYHQTGNIKSDNFPVGTHPPQRKVVTMPDALQTKWNRRMMDWLRQEMVF